MHIMYCETARAILQIKPTSGCTKLLFNGGSPDSALALDTKPGPPAHNRQVVPQATCDITS
jgi:hypothetical protein